LINDIFLKNQPGYFFSEQVNAAFYTASSYHWGVIGWMDDLRKIDKEDLIAFNERYYVPNNAVAIYVGDLDLCNEGGEKWLGPLEKLGKIHKINLKDPMTGEELR